MRDQLAAVTDRINLPLLASSGDYPDRASRDTLTDGYACALSLDAECERIERRICGHAAQLTGDKPRTHAGAQLWHGCSATAASS